MHAAATARTRMIKRLVRQGSCVLLSLLLLANAHGQETDESKNEQAQAKTRLLKIRADIERESLAREAAQAEHADINAALRDIERSVGAAARAVAETDAELSKREIELAELESERRQLETRLAGQRLKLGALLRSAYVLGRSQQLRAWLARDRLNDSARIAAYNMYLQRHRIRRMSGLLSELDELLEMTARVNQARTELTVRRASSQSEIDVLTLRRAERERLLNELSAKLADHQQRLRAYARDEKSLLDLLERLQDVLADIPGQISDALPLSQLRGRLPWPVAGAVQTAFGATLGSGRVSDGIVIAANTGEGVQAVAHGRVAYADWLRGFGLLIIVDHGDGFMSLYAHNEALLHDVGDWVQASDVLARAGASGGAEQSGLYFELRKDGQPLNPRLWLQKR